MPSLNPCISREFSNLCCVNHHSQRNLPFGSRCDPTTCSLYHWAPGNQAGEPEGATLMKGEAPVRARPPPRKQKGGPEVHLREGSDLCDTLAGATPVSMLETGRPRPPAPPRGPRAHLRVLRVGQRSRGPAWERGPGSRLWRAPASPGDKSFESCKGLVPGKFCLISSSKVAKFPLIVVLSGEVRKTAKGAWWVTVPRFTLPAPLLRGKNSTCCAAGKGLSLRLPVRRAPALSCPGCQRLG